MKPCKLLFRVFLVTAFVLALAGISEGGKVESCRPTWIQLSEKPVSFERNPYVIEFSAVLVGCEYDLQQLTPDNLREVREVISKVLGRHGLRLIALTNSRELREELRKELRNSPGGKSVADVFIVKLSVGESL